MVNLILETNKNYFKNYFSLKFANRQIDQVFNRQNNIVYTKKAFVMSLLTLISEFLINFWFHFNFWNDLHSKDISHWDSNELKEHEQKIEKINNLFILTSLTCAISVINIIIGIAAFKVRRLIISAHFLNYLCICLTCINFRELHFIYYEKSYSIYYSLENLIKFFFLLLVESNYKIISLASSICVIVIWTNGYLNSAMPIVEMIGGTVILVLTPIFSYFIEKNLKILFYYKWKISTKNEWLKSTLDNFQNGLIVLDKYKMHYFNEYVNKKLNFLIEKNTFNSYNTKSSTGFRQRKVTSYDNSAKYVSQAKSLNLKQKIQAPTCIPKATNNFLYYATCNDNTFNNNSSVLNVKKSHNNFEEYYLNKFLFQNLQNLNPELSCEVIESIQNKNLFLRDLLEVFDKDNKINNTFTEFQFIGSKRFENETENEELTILEIYVRIVQKEDNKIAFEFIFNDVTRCIVLEEAKAQIKYKTLFLAKVAHEFKNPLIIIKELVDQILDDNNNSKENVSNLLLLSKNLCSYMLILVKDFEVISKKENNTKIELNQSYFDIREEMQYLNQIVNTLIAKKYEDTINAPIKFILDVPHNIPCELYTDKNRLSQILINLLSNSIKFTHNGTIKLQLELIQNEDGKNKINFTVCDTGTGVTDIQVKNLYKHFYKANDANNSYGSGLGLIIVKELCNVLGSKISFQHNEPNGCKFSFEIDYIERTVHSNKDKSISIYDGKINELSEKFENVSSFTQNEPLLKRYNTSYNLQYAITEFNKSRILKKQKGILKKINTTFIDISNNSLNKFTNNRKIPSRNNSINFCSFGNQLLKVQLEEPNINHHIEDSMNTIYRTNSLMSVDKSKLKNPTTYNNKLTTQFTSMMLFNTPSNYQFINPSPISFNNHEFKISSFSHTQISDDCNFPKCNSNIKKITKIYKRTKNKRKKETTEFSKSKISSSDILEYKNLDSRKLTIIISDDDGFVRKSILRQLDNYFTSLKLDLELTVFEVTDGIECLYTIYNAILQSIFIDLIITDETMKYMSGSLFSEFFSRLNENNIFPYKIPVFIVTSYEDNINSDKKYSSVCGLFTKPVSPDILEKIFKIANIHF